MSGHVHARIRVVAYAKNGVHDCDTSAPFTIGATTGVPGDPGAGGLLLRAAGNPGAAPVLEWEAPAGTRAWLRLYDVRGRLVATLVDGVEGGGSGPRRAGWDGRDTRGASAPPGKSALGLTVAELTEAQKRELKIKNGVRVESAEGAAARAGVRDGDVVLAIDNTEVADVKQFLAIAAKVEKSRAVSVMVKRGEFVNYLVIRPAR